MLLKIRKKKRLLTIFNDANVAYKKPKGRNFRNNSITNNVSFDFALNFLLKLCFCFVLSGGKKNKCNGRRRAQFSRKHNKIRIKTNKKKKHKEWEKHVSGRGMVRLGKGE